MVVLLLPHAAKQRGTLRDGQISILELWMNNKVLFVVVDSCILAVGLVRLHKL